MTHYRKFHLICLRDLVHYVSQVLNRDKGWTVDDYICVGVDDDIVEGFGTGLEDDDGVGSGDFTQ